MMAERERERVVELKKAKNLCLSLSPSRPGDAWGRRNGVRARPVGRCGPEPSIGAPRDGMVGAGARRPKPSVCLSFVSSPTFLPLLNWPASPSLFFWGRARPPGARAPPARAHPYLIGVVTDLFARRARSSLAARTREREKRRKLPFDLADFESRADADERRADNDDDDAAAAPPVAPSPNDALENKPNDAHAPPPLRTSPPAPPAPRPRKTHHSNKHKPKKQTQKKNKKQKQRAPPPSRAPRTPTRTCWACRCCFTRRRCRASSPSGTACWPGSRADTRSHRT
jgi:hypothetical protein